VENYERNQYQDNYFKSLFHSHQAKQIQCNRDLVVEKNGSELNETVSGVWKQPDTNRTGCVSYGTLLWAAGSKQFRWAANIEGPIAQKCCESEWARCSQGPSGPDIPIHGSKIYECSSIISTLALNQLNF
jgi:hypothetical protein